MSETPTINTVDTAKIIRKQLADFFPGVKFSVRAPHYGSIDISWTDGPTTKTVDAVAKFFQCQSYDGMTESHTYYNRFWEGKQVHFAANYVMTQRSESNEFIAAVLPIVCKKYGQPVPEIRYEKGRICVWDWDNGTVCGRDTLRDLVMQAVYATDSRLLGEPTNPAEKLRTLAENMQKEIDGKRRDHDWNMTARRANIEAGQAMDAKDLENIQDKLHAIAWKWEAGYIDESLRRVNTRILVEQLVHNHFPSPQTQSAEYKRLVAAGLGNEDAFRHAAFELSLLGDPEIGKRTPSDELHDLEVKVTLQKIDGFFPTPEGLAKRMVERAGIESGMTILEPSAGKGDIATLIPGCDVIEANHDLRKILEIKGFNLLFQCYDFLEFEGKYDRIIMNPPFEHFQDIDHVRHAYECLKDGGRLVAIMSAASSFRNDKKAVEFRDWLGSVLSAITPLEAGTFLDSDRPTGVNTQLVVIDKPAAKKETEALVQETPIMDTNTSTPEVTSEVAPVKAVDERVEVAQIRALIDHQFDLCEVALRKGIPILNQTGKQRLYAQILRMAHEAYGQYYAACNLTNGNFLYPTIAAQYRQYTQAAWSGLGLPADL